MDFAYWVHWRRTVLRHAALPGHAFFAVLESRKRDGNNVPALPSIDLQAAKIRRVAHGVRVATLREIIRKVMERVGVVASAFDIRELQRGRRAGEGLRHMARGLEST